MSTVPKILLNYVYYKLDKIKRKKFSGTVHTWGSVNVEDDDVTTEELWPRIIQSEMDTNVNSELKEEVSPITKINKILELALELLLAFF